MNFKVNFGVIALGICFLFAVCQAHLQVGSFQFDVPHDMLIPKENGFIMEKIALNARLNVESDAIPNTRASRRGPLASSSSNYIESEEELVIDGRSIARTIINDGCPRDFMIQAADDYLFSQVTPNATLDPHRFDSFIAVLAPNVTISSNLGPVTVGFNDVVAVLLGIGQQYQNISKVYKRTVRNYVAKNAVTSSFFKDQRDITLGSVQTLEFFHTITFIQPDPSNPNFCQVDQIHEHANAFATFNSLPSLTSNPVVWMCEQLADIVCKDNMPSFGTKIDNLEGVKPAGKCYYFWKDAPIYSQNNDYKESSTINQNAKSLACFAASMTVAKNNPPYAPFICPTLGKKIDGMLGCWNS